MADTLGSGQSWSGDTRRIMTRCSSEKTDDSLSKRRFDDRSKLETVSACFKSLFTCTIPSPEPLYETLPYPDSIRLLKIHPAEPGREIKCSLQLARLNNRLPAYQALSYVWLLRPGKKTIICNGYEREVPTNLYDALKRLRDTAKPKLIWVDNLCIAQDNTTEKNHQVRRMNQVYHKANRVIVWLGTDEQDEAHRAFASLCTLVNAHRSASRALATITTVRKLRSYSIPCTHSPPPLESREWAFVAALFENKWWSRMWVLQEIALARCASVVWGCAELDWWVVGEAIGIIRKKPYLHSLLECRNLQNAFFMNHLRKLQLSKLARCHPFLHLLDLSRSFDVTYEVDKVYGLLGFSNADSGAESIYSAFVPPRYGTPVEETYAYVARAVLLTTQNLDILSFTSHTNQDFKEQTPGWPLWVPDWTCKDIVFPMMSFGLANQHKAGKFKDISMACLDEGDNHLKLRGVMLDTISDSISQPSFTELYQATPKLKTLLDWCITHVDVSAPTLSATLTAGRDAQGGLISDPLQHVADLSAFLISLDPKGFHSTWPEEAQMLADIALRRGNPDTARLSLWKYSCYRSAFTTESGKLGLGPGAVKRGDIVVVLFGGQVPYVLREGEGEENGLYLFVGECYIEGVMKGEVGETAGYLETDFELV